MTDQTSPGGHEENAEGTPLEPPAPEGVQPSAQEILGAALGSAAKRAGLDPSQSASTGHVVWAAMGGWRGVAESVLPSLAFIVAYTITSSLIPALAISVGLAVVFTVIRLVGKSTPTAALAGLITTVLAAALALWTGRGADNFVWGFITNGAYGGALLISALVGWPLIGLAVGFLMGDGPSVWRADQRKRRTFFWLTIAWAGLFVLRLAIQLPVYFSAIAAGDDTADVALLGSLKLIMGLPLFAPLVAVTWLTVRALYRKSDEVAAVEGDDAS